jgi:hypothetical protein
MFAALVAFLIACAACHAQDDGFDPTESYRAVDSGRNTTRVTPDGLGGYRSVDSEGNTTRIKRDGLGGYRATDSEGNTARLKPTGFDSPSSYDRAPVDADDYESDAEHRSAWALGVDDRRSPAGRDEQERASQHDEGFAAASGKCGDVTTQRIGNFYYDSNGGVTQKVGNFLYGPDGEVTQKIGNFYHHSDGTTTQRIGNFYYDSDGGVTQKIGSFYYHSGGKPCDAEGER